MSMLVDLKFAVTRKPAPLRQSPDVTSEVAKALAATYGKDESICILIDGMDERRFERLRHNLTNIGHKAKAKFGVSTQRGTDADGRAVLFAWAREPRVRRQRARRKDGP